MQNVLPLLSQNWKSAATVALVSIPLSLALAIASGASPTQGIITAFWAGLIGAIFGGSNFNIMGPTGALSGILLAYVLANGYTGLPVIAILSGILILLAYFLRLHTYIIFIPKSVVHGFTLGVAFIIGLGQLNNMLGLVNVPKHDTLLQNTIASLQHYPQIQWGTLLLFLMGTTFIFFWNKKFPKIPGAILLATTSIVLLLIVRMGFHAGSSILTLGDIYPSVTAALYENVWTKATIALFLSKQVWIVSFATALIAILESLLSGQIADGMTNTRFNRPREVLALGLANIASGLAGGIPATAALARTALNIKSGATHKTSGIISSIFILIISLLIFQYFKFLPMVVIASILVIVAIGMVEKKHFITLLDNEKAAFALSIVVALITIFEDPMAGILTGTVIALLIFVHKISYGQTEILIWKDGKMVESILKNDFIKKSEFPSDLVVYKISGTLTFVNMPAHLEAVKKIKGNKHVIVSLRHAFYADADGVEYLEELIKILKSKNDKVFLSGVNKEIEKKIKKEDFYKKKILEGKIYSRTSEAIKGLFTSFPNTLPDTVLTSDLRCEKRQEFINLHAEDSQEIAVLAGINSHHSDGNDGVVPL